MQDLSLSHSPLSLVYHFFGRCIDRQVHVLCMDICTPCVSILVGLVMILDVVDRTSASIREVRAGMVVSI